MRWYFKTYAYLKPKLTNLYSQRATATLSRFDMIARIRRFFFFQSSWQIIHWYFEERNSGLNAYFCQTATPTWYATCFLLLWRPVKSQAHYVRSRLDSRNFRGSRRVSWLAKACQLTFERYCIRFWNCKEKSNHTQTFWIPFQVIELEAMDKCAMFRLRFTRGHVIQYGAGNLIRLCYFSLQE